MDSLFENTTSDFPLHDDGDRSFGVLLVHYLQILVCLLGLICDFTLIFIVLKGKNMKSRCNALLATRCTYEALFLFTEVTYDIFAMCFGRYVVEHQLLDCLDRHTLGLFETAVAAITVLLLFDKVVNTNELQTKTLLLSINLTILVYYIAQVLQCIKDLNSRHYVEVVLGIATYLSLLSGTLTKEVQNCRCRMSDESKYRFNLARMTCYNYILYVFFVDLMHDFTRYYWRLFRTLMYMNALFTFAYVVCVDGSFKKCFLRMLRGRFDFDDVGRVTVENSTYANLGADLNGDHTSSK